LHPKQQKKKKNTINIKNGKKALMKAPDDILSCAEVIEEREIERD